ncbi:hypothetical protein ACFPRL_12580 [Pseudoclavibacter helvolus]
MELSLRRAESPMCRSAAALPPGALARRRSSADAPDERARARMRNP